MASTSLCPVATDLSDVSPLFLYFVVERYFALVVIPAQFRVLRPPVTGSLIPTELNYFLISGMFNLLISYPLTCTALLQCLGNHQIMITCTILASVLPNILH